MSTWSECLANGIKVDSSGPLPVRKEINTLSDAELFLFVEGMRRFQQVDHNDTLSYFQIAGIHGMPYQAWPIWDKDVPVENKDVGFCTHTSVLFLTWHRPYLALFESVLYKHVTDVVEDLETPDEKTKPDHKSWKQLAQEFRLPYWDWARWQSPQHFPKVAQDNSYPVQSPPKFKSSAKKLKTDYNPLFSAPFQAGTSSQINFAKGPGGQALNRTARYPGESASKGLADLEAAMNSLFTTETRSPLLPKNLSERVGYILQSYGRFNPMSNNRLPTNPKTSTGGAEGYGSFEDIHNSVHDLVGGEGHMSDIAVSAFDPIFWLHHANIDRLCAIWEAIHQDDSPGQEQTWVTKTWSQGTWAFKDGYLDSSTPLYPFRHATSGPKEDANYPNGFFTSNSIKRTEDFGYAYPEILGIEYPLSSAARRDLGNRMELQYQLPSTSLKLSADKVETAGQELLPQAALLKHFAEKSTPATSMEKAKAIASLPDQQTLLKASLAPSKPVLRNILHANKYHEWLIDVKAEKHALRGAYSVHFFLGDVQEDNAYLWPTSPYYVGSFVPLGQNSETSCGKCQKEQRERLQITGQIPLTLALMERYLAELIPDLSVPTVVEFLKLNLHWRVKLDGQVVEDRSQVDGLTVFVVTNEVTLPTDGSRPTYAPDVVIHPEITTNRSGTGRGNGTGLTEGQI